MYSAGWEIGSARTPYHIIGGFIVVLIIASVISNRENKRLGKK